MIEMQVPLSPCLTMIPAMQVIIIGQIPQGCRLIVRSVNPQEYVEGLLLLGICKREVHKMDSDKKRKIRKASTIVNEES